MAKQTVVFDFDGVINSYTSRWQGVTVIPDPPVEGIREAIVKIRRHYRVVVVSSRCSQPGGIEAIQAYLKQHHIIVDDIAVNKPPAIVYIDDRALTFDGHPEELLNKIKSFRPWNKH